MTEGNEARLYQAVIGERDSNRLGQRVTVWACNVHEAKRKLEAQYGEGNVYSLWNEEEASRLRM